MAAAAIIVGILSGITCFVMALVLGHGLLAAAGFYVVGGFLGAACLAVLAIARTSGEQQHRRIPVVLRG